MLEQTGGNLAEQTALAGRPLYAGLATSGALPAPQTAPARGLEIGPLPKAGKVTLTARQLRTTQKCSQRAIVLANRVNDRITSGLTEGQFQSGSISVTRFG